MRDALPDELPAVREFVRSTMWEAYEDARQERPSRLPEDLTAELDDLATRYDALLVAGPTGDPVGCVGLRPLGDSRSAVMNRLYVLPAHRRAGLGRRLAAAAVDRARDLGYARVVLDVIPQRRHVIDLYRSLGFTEVDPFVEYPFKMVFLGRAIQRR